MKQNLRFILLTLLCAVFSSALAENVTDVLNRNFTGVTSGAGYSEWSGKTSNSDAVYAGNSAGGNDAIQLRSNNNNSGVVTTASGGKVTKIKVTWNSNTTSGRTITVYGKNTAYTAATDLYNSSTQGTSLGTIAYGSSTELTISGDYSFIGFRSASGALYLDEVQIEWTSGEQSGPSAPVITPNGGNFISTQTVAISADEGCSIYYTLNSNDDPTLYEEPFIIDATTTVKAIAVNSDNVSSNVVSATFTKIPKPLAPSFNPETDTYIKAGTRIYIIPNNQSVVNGVVIIINDGEPNARATSGNNYVEITEEMADEQGKVKIEAYNTYTLGGFNSDGESLEGEHATATYFVVDPVVNIDTPSTVFIDEIDVTLSASPENATIIYTTDGSNPTTSSTTYTYSSPIHLEVTTPINAIAVMGNVKSEVKTATYTLSEPATAGSENWIRIANVQELQEACTNEYPIIFTNHEVTGGANAKKAMSKTHSSSNNRAAVSLSTTLQDNAKVLSLTADEEAAVAQLKCIYTEGKGYQWYDQTYGYFQATTADKNQFNCYQSSNTNFKEDYTYTDVTFNANDDGKDVTVEFNTEASDVTRHLIRYNESSSLFSAYKSGQQAVSLYYKGNLSVVNLYEKPSEFDITSDENTIEAQSGVTVNLYRSLTANVWNAICLPFDMNETQMKTLFGEDYALEELDDVVTDNGNTSINFKPASEFKAGVPYLVLPTQSVAKKAVVVINGVNIVADEPTEVTAGGYSFKGFYNPYNPCGSEDDFKNYFFIGANNKFQYFNSTTTQLRAFRCYFHVPEGSTPANLSLSTDNNGITESISLTEVDGLSTNLTTRVYTISGQYVGKSTENLSKGIYIVNGRKFIVK